MFYWAKDCKISNHLHPFLPTGNNGLWPVIYSIWGRGPWDLHNKELGHKMLKFMAMRSLSKTKTIMETAALDTWGNIIGEGIRILPDPLLLIFAFLLCYTFNRLWLSLADQKMGTAETNPKLETLLISSLWSRSFPLTGKHLR